MNLMRSRRWLLLLVVAIAVTTAAGYFILRAPARERQLYGTWHLYSENDAGVRSYNLIDYRFSPGHRFESRPISYHDGAYRYGAFVSGNDRWLVEPSGELVFVSPQTLGSMLDQLLRRIRGQQTTSREREWGYLSRLSEDEYLLSFGSRPSAGPRFGVNGYVLVRVDPTSEVAPAPNRAGFGE